MCNQTTELCFGASELGYKQATKQQSKSSFSDAENGFVGYETT
jgi:hypothetical protein